MTDTPGDRSRFRFVVMAIATALKYRDHVDDAYLRVMFNAMDDVPIEVLERSVQAVSRGRRFMPTPAEWREVLDALPLPAALGLLPAAESRAGGAVSMFCRQCGDSSWIERVGEDGRVYARPCPCRHQNPALGAGRKTYAKATQEA